MPTPRYISVVNYHTGRESYIGTSELEAAKYLERGFVFGTGSSEASAKAHAMRRVAEQVGTIQGANHG